MLSRTGAVVVVVVVDDDMSSETGCRMNRGGGSGEHDNNSRESLTFPTTRDSVDRRKVQNLQQILTEKGFEAIELEPLFTEAGITVEAVPVNISRRSSDGGVSLMRPSLATYGSKSPRIKRLSFLGEDALVSNLSNSSGPFTLRHSKAHSDNDLMGESNGQSTLKPKRNAHSDHELNA